MFHTTIEAAEATVAERRRQASRIRETARPTQSTTSRRRLVAALLSGAALLAACGTPAPVESPVTEAQAVEMAENALRAFNSGDYAAWSADWSEEMKAAINEETFLAFRDQAHAQLGDFVAIKSVAGAPGENAGAYRWTFQVQFEQADYVVWFGFKEGSPLIEGVQFEEPTA